MIHPACVAARRWLTRRNRTGLPAKRRRRFLLLAALATATGCQSTTPQKQQIDPLRVDEHDDIVAIHNLWNPVPWLKDSVGRVVGFQVPAYLVSGETEKGAFAPGTIIVWIYTIERGADGKIDRRVAHIWEFDRDKAMGFRVRKRAIAGYYYGFVLKWPAELNLDAREIEIVFGYERRDGHVVLGTPHRRRVPVAPGFAPPASHEPTRASRE
jgi:hypothetical protein